jgi:integrase
MASSMARARPAGRAPQAQSPAVRAAVPRSGAALFVFSSSTGSPLSHSNFRRRVWLPALAAVGLEGVHFHDLRHTGNQLTADAGANPKELMARMGQDSKRATLIYLHSSAGRQRALADEVGRMAAAALAKAKSAEPSGTQRAREQNTPVNPSGGSVSDLGL